MFELDSYKLNRCLKIYFMINFAWLFLFLYDSNNSLSILILIFQFELSNLFSYQKLAANQFWWQPTTLLRRRYKFARELTCSLTTMLKLASYFSLSLLLSYPFHLLIEIHSARKLDICLLCCCCCCCC